MQFSGRKGPEGQRAGRAVISRRRAEEDRQESGLEKKPEDRQESELEKKRKDRRESGMHELGVVFHIMDSLEKVAVENEVTGISRVVLELGEVSTVIESYLHNCWQWAAKKRELFEEAELVVETIPARTYCEGCGQTYATVEHGKICPCCHSPDTWLLQGNEFNIKEIEVY